MSEDKICICKRCGKLRAVFTGTGIRWSCEGIILADEGEPLPAREKCDRFEPVSGPSSVPCSGSGTT